MTSGCQIAFQADPSYEDPLGGPSLEHPEITGLPTNPARDQRNASSSAVIARTAVLDLTGSAVVGRVFMFNADGQPAFAQSLRSYEAACQASALPAPDSCPVLTWFAVVCGGGSGARCHGLRATGPERRCGWSWWPERRT